MRSGVQTVLVKWIRVLDDECLMQPPYKGQEECTSLHTKTLGMCIAMEELVCKCHANTIGESVKHAYRPNTC